MREEQQPARGRAIVTTIARDGACGAFAHPTAVGWASRYSGEGKRRVPTRLKITPPARLHLIYRVIEGECASTV
jgi:hypothetical protein